MFKCVVHHSTKFASFTKPGYQGLETIWDVGPDYWSYFEILGMLKDLGYPTVDKIWYYDENNIPKAFNSVFVTARAKPIVTMLKEIRVYIMQRWESNRKKIGKYEDTILPNIKKRMEMESQKINHWIMR